MKRNKRRLKRGVKNAMMAVALVAMWVAIGAMALNVWAGHPAEQHVSGMVYLETVGGGN